MATTRSTFTLDQTLAEQARDLGVNISCSARNGVAAAVRAALAERDRLAYEQRPEIADSFWDEAESFDHVAAGIDRESVINCDSIHTLRQTVLITQVGEVGEATMNHVCAAASYAIGC
jgi:post-segregation antitoxin (ccd killing protein)